MTRLVTERLGQPAQVPFTLPEAFRGPRGISAYREIEGELAVGDRVQLTAANRDLQIANQELATLQISVTRECPFA